MNRYQSSITLWLVAAAFFGHGMDCAAAEDSPAKYVRPKPNRKGEPQAAEFSLAKAVSFLDSAAVSWGNTHGCVTCHTNGLYLAARPLVSGKAPANLAVRQLAREYLLEDLLEKELPKGGDHEIQDLVATAAFLAISDARSTGELHPTTRAALDSIWNRQSEEGLWDWAKCNWPPYEIDDHFGVTLAALGVGIAPDDYAQTPAAKEGLEKIRRYLTKHPPANPHQKGMTLWAARYVPDLVAPDDRRQWIDDLFELQQSDGGWSAASLGGGDWKRDDGTPQDTHSDGYGTGFVIYTLREAGIEADDPRLQRGIQWIKMNQRASGRWYTRSPKRDTRHFITHAATNFVVMALIACGEELPDP